MPYSTSLEINSKIEKIKQIIFDSCDGIGKYRYDFQQFNECAYRSIVAVCLNNVINEKISVEEQAGDGRSDISIRLDKNIDFIVECKIWHHKNEEAVKSLQSAFNQLIRYSPVLSHNYFSIIIFNTFFQHNKKEDDANRNNEFYKISQLMIEKLKQMTDINNIGHIEKQSPCSWLMYIKNPQNQKDTEIFICFCNCPNKNKKS
ncbi:MAG: hypothetical protein Q2306_00055 [Phytoplasma sp.]|uniref:hypothetical protein n=1 Tax=Phytoplasma sp. TaxID=2155 RepID=UPI002B40C337|nr:hypothetical protein [Phytoplasma sp.]WRH06747.1 MAG: hypothetical protein Q2306_00055 [Phytoplasma sp.]